MSEGKALKCLVRNGRGRLGCKVRPDIAFEEWVGKRSVELLSFVGRMRFVRQNYEEREETVRSYRGAGPR